MGRSVSTPMANTTQSMTRCDNLQARCPARPVSNRTCSITAGEITLLSPASRSTTVSASGLVSKQLPCRVIVIASLKPGSYTDPRLQEVMTCAKTNGIEFNPGWRWADDQEARVFDRRMHCLVSHLGLRAFPEELQNQCRRCGGRSDHVATCLGPSRSWLSSEGNRSAHWRCIDGPAIQNPSDSGVPERLGRCRLVGRSGVGTHWQVTRTSCWRGGICAGRFPLCHRRGTINPASDARRPEGLPDRRLSGHLHGHRPKTTSA